MIVSKLRNRLNSSIRYELEWFLTSSLIADQVGDLPSDIYGGLRRISGPDSTEYPIERLILELQQYHSGLELLQPEYVAKQGSQLKDQTLE